MDGKRRKIFYIDNYLYESNDMRNNEKVLASKYVEEINRIAENIEHVRLMEVCGTHTVSIFRAGIHQILPKNIELVSGPGCPVCVTADDYIDKAIAYSKLDDVIIATFGDMLKVPGSTSSLTEAQGEGVEEYRQGRGIRC